MIRHIKTQRCPKCNSEIVEQSLKHDWRGNIQQHGNGQRWETVRFACGLKIEWIPNFEAEQVVEYSECENDPAVKAARTARDNLIDRMAELVKAAKGVDKHRKDELLNSFVWRKSSRF